MPLETDQEMNWANVGNFIFKVGIPGALAVFLVYWVTIRADQKLLSIENAAFAHQTETRALTNSVESVRLQQDRTNLILQQICVNGAAVRDRPNCFR